MSGVNEKNPSDTEVKKDVEDSPKGKRIDPKVIVFFAVIVAAILFAAVTIFKPASDGGGKTVHTQKQRTVTVTGIRASTERYRESESETGSFDTEQMETEKNFENEFFGAAPLSVTSGRLTVSGLTTKDKERTGFRESDFVKAVANFLSDNGMRARKIELLSEISCSSDAIAYEAEIDGRDDKILSVLFYPNFPGKYLFLLHDEQRATLPQQTQQTQIQQAQIQQGNVPVVQNVMAQTDAIQVQTEAAQTESSYDATRLSIINLPSSLQNYLDNDYELQYSLYDYLYRNGYREVKSVTCEDFQIDAGTRTATIYFKMADGNIITGSYDKDSNAYSFR